MADQRLDQVMLDVKQTSTITSQAKTDLTEQVKTTEALRDILSSVDAEQRKILASQLDIGESMSESKKTIEAMKESLNKIPSVSKAIDVIQKKTGKSYKDSLDMIQKSLEATKKHTKANQANLEAVKALQKVYKQNSDQIERGTKSIKDLGKTEQQIAKEKIKTLQKQLALTKQLMGHIKTMGGGAGASYLGGSFSGTFGMAGMGARKATESIIGRRVAKEKMTEERGEQLKLGLEKVGSVVTGGIQLILDANMYELQKNVQMTVAKTRLKRFGGISGSARGLYEGTSDLLSREETMTYAEQSQRMGIVPESPSGAQKELSEFAANSKYWGDEINANITDKMITSSQSIEESWKHINRLGSGFRDIAKQSNIPLEELMKTTAEIAVQARFLNIDYKTIMQTQKALAGDKGLLKAGLTRKDMPGIAQNMMLTMGKAPLSMRAYWGTRAGLTGGTDKIIQQVSMGGRYGVKNAAGTGYDLMGEEKGGKITTSILQEMKKDMMKLGYTGAVTAAQSGYFPGFGEKEVRALMYGKEEDWSKLAEKIEEPKTVEESQLDKLTVLVKYETLKQKWMDHMATVFSTNKDIWEKIAAAKALPGELVTTFGKHAKKVDISDVPPLLKKHTGGLIPRGTVSEVLTNESMQHLGKDSFFAFNPTHDIKIGSPQTTKESLRRSLPSAGLGGEQRIEVNLNVAGSVITDNELLSKIESLFANRRGLV